MSEFRQSTFPRLGQTLAQAALLLAFLTLVSRVVGLLRVRIFTSYFGAGEILDTYYAAFRIPDFLMGVFIVGTLSVAALPVIAEYLVRKPERTRYMVANLINITSTCMLVLCVLVGVAAPYLVALIVPGFSEAQQQDVVLLTRLILAAEVLLSVANLTTTALNAAKRFFVGGDWSDFLQLGFNCRCSLVVSGVWHARLGLRSHFGRGAQLGLPTPRAIWRRLAVAPGI